MADIRSLLNPLPDKNDRKKSTPTISTASYFRDFSPPPTPRKKQKVAKDAAVFIRGNTRGPVNYPPYEQHDPDLRIHHQRFGLNPMEDIGAYPRHIPYNSEKKTFMERTGRESLEGSSSIP